MFHFFGVKNLPLDLDVEGDEANSRPMRFTMSFMVEQVRRPDHGTYHLFLEGVVMSGNHEGKRFRAEYSCDVIEGRRSRVDPYDGSIDIFEMH